MIDFDEWLYIFGSAHEARDRLKEVIAADRAAVPCGRWVRINPVPSDPVERINYYALVPYKGIPMPRYRYKVRR